MAPMESEIRRPRAASPAPRKSAASAGTAGDENAQCGGAGNMQLTKPAEDILKTTPAKQQSTSQKEKPIEAKIAAAAHPAWGTRRRVLLVMAALSVALLVIASIATWAIDLAAGGVATAAVANMARQFVEGASTRASSVLHGTSSARAAMAARALLVTAAFTAATVAVAQRRKHAASTIGETKEKDA